jgi:hypothetical protein
MLWSCCSRHTKVWQHVPAFNTSESARTAVLLQRKHQRTPYCSLSMTKHGNQPLRAGWWPCQYTGPAVQYDFCRASARHAAEAKPESSRNCHTGDDAVHAHAGSRDMHLVCPARVCSIDHLYNMLLGTPCSISTLALVLCAQYSMYNLRLHKHEPASQADT